MSNSKETGIMRFKDGIIVFADEDYDGTIYFIAKIEGKDGLIGSGTTIEDAIQDLKDAEPLWEEYVKEIEESKNKEG